MDKIADAFQISKTSVKNEMSDIDVYVRKYHLEVEKKSHYGVRITGDSKIYKDMLAELYFENNIILNQEVDMQLGDFKNINAILVSQIEKENLNINDNELKKIIVYLQVSAFYALLTKEIDDTKVMKKLDAIERIAWIMKEAESLFENEV